MPPSLSHVRDLLTAYLTVHPGEHPAPSGLLNSLDTEGDPTHRTTLPGHITCSAGGRHPPPPGQPPTNQAAGGVGPPRGPRP
ncbi:hypothetical protein ACFV0D_12440, partial [Streptomyces sp. NPDC059556]